MKKLPVILLVVAMIFAFAACGQQEAPAEEAAAENGLAAVLQGAELSTLELSNDYFGNYTAVDLPEGIEVGDGVEVQMYYSEGSDTPYVLIYRWAKDGKTLEEKTAQLVEAYDVGGYQMYHWDVLDTEAGRYTAGAHGVDGNYYYVECELIEAGDDFVEIDFYAATEELALGDSGKYLWVPVGYTDELTEDEIANGSIFDATYAEQPLPNIWVGKNEDTYAYLEWIWGDIYPEGLPVDEAAYNGWLEQAKAAGEWTEELNKLYYESFGCTLVKSINGEEDGVAFQSNHITHEGVPCVDLFLHCGEECYHVILSSADFSTYSKALVQSLHSK